MSFFEVLSGKDETMFGKQNRKAFTIIELLVVVAIIGLLVSIMVPSIQNALDIARDRAVEAQLQSVRLGLLMFKRDFLAFPSSDDADRPGAQLLSDALVGENLRGPLIDPTDPPTGDRKDPYIQVGSMEFEEFDPGGVNNESYVMSCKWGQPVLYYAAAQGARPTWQISSHANPLAGPGIYDADDNDDFFTNYESGIHSNDPLADDTNYSVTSIDDGGPGGNYNYGGYGEFYNFILNPEMPLDSVWGSPGAHNVDSFILISAGLDQQYGTEDDVTNFPRD